MISLRGLPELTWLELKIFLREPMGAVMTVAIPAIAFIVFGKAFSGRRPPVEAPTGILATGGLPTLVSLLIVISAVVSLVTIISIYREGGILKRLRATPLRPYTILTAHVLVKIMLAIVSIFVMLLAGKRYFAVDAGVPVASFACALLLSTWSVLAIGFVIASIVPTARFAQPIGALIIYPMIAISGLFMPLEMMPPKLAFVARCLPFTYIVSLLQGIWRGESWSAHSLDVAALGVVFVVCMAVSSRVFRWE